MTWVYEITDNLQFKQYKENNMPYIIKDLIEPDNGCEGFMPGEEPMVTLILSDDNGNERKVQLPDVLAYRLKWDVGTEVTSEEVEKYCK